MPAHDDWLLRGHAAATIAFNDPVWAAQTYEMDRGERTRGDYDPPLPSHLVDELRDRQKRLNALEDLMAAEGRTEDPPMDLRSSWFARMDRCCSPAGHSIGTVSAGCRRS